MKRRTRQQRTISMLVQRIGIATVLALTLTVFRDSLRVDSGTITRNASEALSITGGVLTIVPGGVGDDVMEIGNNGSEIISTGAIYIRPNGSQPGTMFVGMADTTSDLLLTGKMDVQGAITLDGESRSTWPFPDHWMTVQNEQGVTTLTPNERSIVLSIGYQQTNDTALAGLSLYSADWDYQALYVDNNHVSRYAANFNDTNVTIYGDLNFTTKLYVCGSTAEACHTTPAFYKIAWTKANMYLSDGGGIDADKLDGIDTYFVGDCNGQQGAVCLCTTMPYGASRCKTLAIL